MAAEKVLMDGAIRIFKRTDKVSKYWQARFKLDDHPKPVIKSTKKTGIEDASKWAKVEFYRLVAKKEVGINVTARTFAVVAREYLKEAEQDADIGTRSARSVKDAKAVIERYMIPFFGKMAIDAISHEQIDNFKRWRATYWTKGPGSKETEISFKRGNKVVKIKRKPEQRNQRSGELSYLRAVFKFAIRKGWIKNDDIPLIFEDRNVLKNSPNSLGSTYEFDEGFFENAIRLI